MIIRQTEEMQLKAQGFLSAKDIRQLVWEMRLEDELPDTAYNEIIFSLDTNGDYVYPAIALLQPFL